MGFLKGLTLCFAASVFTLAFFVSESSAASVCNSKVEFTPGTYDCQGEDVEIGSRTPYNSAYDYRLRPYYSGGTFTFTNVGEWKVSVSGQGVSGQPCTESPHYGGPGATVNINAQKVNTQRINLGGGWGCSDRPEFGYYPGAGGNGGYLTINAQDDVIIGYAGVGGGTGDSGDAPAGDIRITSKNGVIRSNSLWASSYGDWVPGGNIYLTGNSIYAKYVNVAGTYSDSIQSSGSKCIYPAKQARAGRLVVKGGTFMSDGKVDVSGMGSAGLADFKNVGDVRVSYLKLGGDGGCYKPGGKGFSCVQRCYDSGSTLRVRDNVCISPTGCEGQPSGRTPYPGGISYGAPVFSFGAVCGSGTTEVDGQCVGTACGPGTTQINGQCTVTSQPTTVDFHGRAIFKDGQVLKDGSVQFSVSDSVGNVVYPKITKNGMIVNGLFDHIVGGTGDPAMMLELGEQYTLNIIVSDKVPFDCGGSSNCETYNIPFVA